MIWVQVFDTPQVSTVLRSNLMRLYFPVDLTGNLIMIEKLVRRDLNRGPPDLQPDANLCVIMSSYKEFLTDE